MAKIEKVTATAGEIITYLQKHPEDTEVFATWEGVNAPILIENFQDHRNGQVVVDVEDH